MTRKLYVTLILILFLLPFVSWYYLQSGLKWRKQAQDLMKGTQAFPEGTWTDWRGQSLSPATLDDHVTLVALIECNSSPDMVQTLNRIYDQFKETKKSNYIILDQCTTPSVTVADSLKTNWFVFSCTDSLNLCKSLLTQWPAGKTHALVDKNKIIRSYYTAATDDDKRILLEHMALLLPRERSEKVELKRGDKK